MKLTLLDNNCRVLKVISRVKDFVHCSCGDLRLTLADKSEIEVKKGDYRFYIVESKDGQD